VIIFGQLIRVVTARTPALAGGIYSYHGIFTLTNNTISNNNANDNGGGVWLSIYYDDAISNIYNNIVWNNSASQGLDLYISNDGDTIDPPSPVNLFNNNFTDAYIQYWSTVSSADNINLNPQFDLDGYHLTASSPCIDAGATVIEPTDDIDGDSRPQGADYDIGADEFVGTSVELLDLDIARFKATKRVSVDGTVEISLAVANNGTIEGSCPATVIGIQDSVEVYNETIEVSDAIGKGPTTHDFPTFTPPTVGDILWTAIVEDEDPHDDDEATAGTTVNP
jgi:hypothetical protein